MHMEGGRTASIAMVISDSGFQNIPSFIDELTPCVRRGLIWICPNGIRSFQLMAEGGGWQSWGSWTPLRLSNVSSQHLKLNSYKLGPCFIEKKMFHIVPAFHFPNTLCGEHPDTAFRKHWSLFV